MIETGVKFNNIHSFNDLNLILAPFTPTPAEPREEYLDIAGRDGSLDFSEALGEIKFKDRKFEIHFSVAPGDSMTFDEKVMQVSNALNGLKCKITFDRDAGYYWEGRIAINKYLQDKNLKQITITATVRPYKLKQNKTVYSFALTGESRKITLLNGRKSTVPQITCTNDNVKVVFGEVETVLSAGTHTILDICLKHGANILNVSGSGTLTITYQEGDL